MNSLRIAAIAGLGACALATGCKKTDDSTANYTRAIDTYYASRPPCLWADEKKFPVQVNTSDADKTSGYDALVDQGLLQRTTGEKKVFILGSKEVTNYDISDKGRGAWTADPQQPGYGNFCYGTRAVASIDSSTPNSGQVGATTTVNYHEKLDGVPAWAQAAETQNAFPQIKTELAGPVPATATLSDTSNGWVVTKGPVGTAHGPATNADGSIVQ
jgi:hypothetical protein